MDGSKDEEPTVPGSGRSAGAANGARDHPGSRPVVDITHVYRESLARRAIPDRYGCVTAEELLRLVERRGSDAERLGTLDHVMDCRPCHDDFSELNAAVVRGRGQRKFVGIGAAAALVLFVGSSFLWLQLGQRLTPRGPERTLPYRFIAWRPLPNAAGYRVELLDASRAQIYTHLTRDTNLALPDSVGLETGERYTWRVLATLPGSLPILSRSFVVPADSNTGPRFGDIPEAGARERSRR